MTTKAQTQANRAHAQKSTGLCVRSDRVSGIGVTDVTPAPSAPVPWASAPNKPNLGHGKTKGKWFLGKELWLIGPAKSTGKTKPNLGAMGDLGAGRAGPWPEPIVRQRLVARCRSGNEANLTGRPGPQRQKCAERTQFFDRGLRITQNEPNLGRER